MTARGGRVPVNATVEPVSAAEYAMMVASRMTEAEFQAQLDGLGDDFGWLNYHTHDSRRSKSGFPDWCAVRGNRLIFAELKIQDERKGKTSPAQDRWLAALRGIAELVEESLRPADELHVLPRLEVYLWRPIDITTNTILEVLR